MRKTNNLMIHIRPFSNKDEDFTALVAINEVLEPDEQLTVALLRQSDEAYIAQYGLLVRCLAEVDDGIAGSGLYFRSEDDEDTLLFSMHVHPDFQESQVPAEIQNYLLAQMKSHEPQKIAAQPKEDQMYRIRLLEEADFELKMRFPRSQLDVNEFDYSRYVDIMNRLKAQGIELVTLTDVMTSDLDWQHNVWRLFNKVSVDIPAPQLVEETPFEEYATYYEGEFFRPDSWAIALDKNEQGADQYVGMCVVNIIDGRPDTLFAGITGTVRSHRRRKIATALKVKNIQYAQQQGYRFIYTDNEENNPMYDLNLQLGFQPLPAWLYYEKTAVANNH
jgi:GNAT superfamily N-acetyltransferase